MAWTTVTNVATKTGVTVTTAQLTQAQGVIEAYLGLDETDSAPWLKARDLRVLAKAVEYQAAYVKAHPEIFTQADVVSLAQPDLSVIRKQGGVATAPIYMAPMAVMALRHFRFAGPRSVQLESELTSPGVTDTDTAYEGDWQPI